MDTKGKIEGKVIAVIRCRDKDLAYSMAESAIAGGIEVIETTYTIDGAGELIRKLKENFKCITIGAGTVLKQEQAEEAIANGADFIVTPCIVEEVANTCREKGILFSMAGSTSSEIFRAYKMGSEIVKLFPGESFKPSIIKAFKAPFPFIEFMPTGGVNDINVKEWFAAGAFAVGAGGYLTKGISIENVETVRERARKIVDAAQ